MKLDQDTFHNAANRALYSNSTPQAHVMKDMECTNSIHFFANYSMSNELQVNYRSTPAYLG